MVSRHGIQWLGLVAGPLGALALYYLLPDPAPGSEIRLDHGTRASAALALWMGIWWLTEAIPIYATALLPVTLLPISGALPLKDTASAYAHYLIFLFMGGFILALGIERWGLHRRIAYLTLSLMGTSPSRIVAGFMLTTALLSMWVSNTATTIMMLPIATSVIGLAQGRAEGRAEDRDGSLQDPFTLCLLLGIAYSASIGGIGTIIGTPPNLFLVSYASEALDREIGFVQWMAVGVPLVCVFLPILWYVLTRVSFDLRTSNFPDLGSKIKSLGSELGPLQRGERIVLIIFIMAVVGWISRPLLTEINLGGIRPFAHLSDAGIALLAALSLFVIPVDIKARVFVLDWEQANRLPWGLLLLFGGGLSLAYAIRATGLDAYIGHQLAAFAMVPPLILVVLVTVMVIFLTEITSNTATTATFVPLLAAVAIGFELDPFLLIVPAALAASCAFMMPVATPPNAIVFATGKIQIPEMCRVGLRLNLLGILLIPLLVYTVALPVLAIAW